MTHEFNEAEIDRIIGMAWEDRTTFDTIKDNSARPKPQLSNYASEYESVVFPNVARARSRQKNETPCQSKKRYGQIRFAGSTSSR